MNSDYAGLRKLRRSVDHGQEPDTLHVSGMESPISVSELPRSYGSRRHSGNTPLQGEKPMIFSHENHSPSKPVSDPMPEWPRGGLRNAVSRVGYLDEGEGGIHEDTADHERVLDSPTSDISLYSSSAPHTPSSIHVSTPSGARDVSRQRVQHVHLAVPTAMGHVRPRAKPVEYPGEPAASTARKSRPQAVRRMTAHPEPVGSQAATYTRPRNFSQQDPIAHAVAHSPSQWPSYTAHNQRGPMFYGDVPADRAPSRGTQNDLVAGPSPQEALGPESVVDDDHASLDATSSRMISTVDEEKGHSKPEAHGGMRTNPPSSATAMRKSVAEVFSAETERRAAALASRISSRAISRAEGLPDQTRFAQRADVALAAAEQLRKLGAPGPDDPTGKTREAYMKSVDGKERKSNQGSVEVQQGFPASCSPRYDPSLTPDDDATPRRCEELSEKTATDGKYPVPTPPTAPPKDGLSPCPVVSDAGYYQRHRLPRSIQGAQQGLKTMLEAEQQRRAAESASRVRSRVISRTEGSFDSMRFADRSNVARAAAEQLRKIVGAPSREVSQAAPPSNDRKRHSAAAKIQAVWRGHQMRIWVTAARVIAHFTKLAAPRSNRRSSRLKQHSIIRSQCDATAAGC